MQKEKQLKSCLASPLAGEDARRAGEGCKKGNTLLSPLIGFECLRTQNHFPRRGGSHTTNGFTLIELLVVVLIIGILAAVALPQYQKAVDKSRFANLMAITNALADANEVYYLANGQYATDFDELSIDVPATNISGNTATFDWGRCLLHQQQEISCANTTTLKNEYIIVYPHGSASSRNGQVYCIAITTERNSRFDKVCSSFGTYSYQGFGHFGQSFVYQLSQR